MLSMDAVEGSIPRVAVHEAVYLSDLCTVCVHTGHKCACSALLLAQPANKKVGVVSDGET